MAEQAPRRFEMDWDLEVEHQAPEVLQAALAPESQGHHTMQVEQGRLVCSGQGSVGQGLHTVDDLLACLTAAVEAGAAGGERSQR